jgi:hypothetical protein
MNGRVSSITPWSAGAAAVHECGTFNDPQIYWISAGGRPEAEASGGR